MIGSISKHHSNGSLYTQIQPSSRFPFPFVVFNPLSLLLLSFSLLQIDWLKSCVGDLAKHAHSGMNPVLHVFDGSANGAIEKTRFNIDVSVASVPSLWPAVAQHLSHKDTTAEAIVMVRPLAPAAQGAVDTVSTNAKKAVSDTSRRRSIGEAHSPSMLIGTIGECCDDDIVFDPRTSTFTSQSKLLATYDEEDIMHEDVVCKARTTATRTVTTTISPKPPRWRTRILNLSVSSSSPRWSRNHRDATCSNS